MADIQFDCIKCGVMFSLPPALEAQRRKDHKPIYCPSGHGQHFEDKSDIEVERDKRKAEEKKLAREREWSADDNEEIARLVASNASLRGHITMIKRRIAQGWCPFCGDKVIDLFLHFSAEHPNLVEKYGS